TRFSRDWSSDVCSSDLIRRARLRVQEVAARVDGIVAGVVELVHDPVDVVPLDRLTERLTDRRPQLLLGRQVVALTPPVVIQQPRSEERRVGKESRSSET